MQSAVTLLLEERIASYVALANKAGKTVSGSDMVEDAVRGQTVGLVIVAGDVSTEIAGRLERLAARSGTPCYRILSRERLGDLLGKGLRSAVGILPGGFVKNMLYELDRFRNFVEEGAHE
jgi:ribosomal protein L7Ae-like RNA K-turn-binding protein